MSNLKETVLKLYDKFSADYITELASCGQFDLSCMDNVSVERSSELLQNVEFVTDKSGVLHQALLLCPFNPLIYVKAGILGMIDKNICDLVQFLHLTEDVIPMIETIAGLSGDSNISPSEIVRRFEKPCAAIACLRGETTEKELTRYFPDVKTGIISSFRIFSPFIHVETSTASFLIDRFVSLYGQQIDEYKVNKDSVQFVRNCTQSEKDVDCVISSFGENDLLSTISQIVGYSGTGGYNDVIRYMDESVKPFLDQAVTYADKKEMERKQEQEKKEAEEAERKEQERKQKEKKEKIEEVALITFGICFLWMIIGCFFKSDFILILFTQLVSGVYVLIFCVVMAIKTFCDKYFR